MATEIFRSTTSESAILSRLFRSEDHTINIEAAESLLRIRFDQPDLARMHELVAMNQEDRLTTEEKGELENYRRVSFLLDLMHSKARQALKKHQTVS